MGLKETFFTDTPDEEAGGKVNAISQNKTLIVDQFTSNVSEPELLQDAKNIKDVFEHFKPEVEVDFSDENGAPVSENLKFKEMKDFEVNNGNGQLIQNSEFLLGVKSNIEANAKMRKQIETNKRLRDVLNKAEDKESLKNALQALLDELNEADNK
jgi:predicted component of type VI protein secretion system